MADVRDIQMNFTANTSQAEQAIQRLKGSTDQASKSLDKQKTSTVNAGGAVISFGRIIQDAPFGIIGVANNITMLSEQFVSLKAQAGSTGAALTAMKAAMFGPLGLTLAISAVTTGLTMLAMSSQKSKSAVVSATDKMKQSFLEAQKAMFETAKTEESKIVILRSLTNVLKDTSAGLEQKKNALAEIQKIYPDYLKGINLENTSQNDLNARIEKGNTLIQKRAEMMAYEARLRKNYETKLDIESQIYASTPNAEDYGNAAQSMGFGRLGADPAMWLKFKNNPNYKALYDSRARLSMIKRMQKTMLQPIDEAIARDTNVIASLAIDTPLTPDAITSTDTGGSGKTSKIKENIELQKSYFDMMKEEIQMTLQIDNLLGRKTGANVYTSYLEIIGQEIQSGKLSQSELLEWLRLRKEVLSEMEEDQGEKWSSFKSFDLFRGIIGNNIKGMEKSSKEDAKKRLKEEQAEAKRKYDIYKELFIDPFVETFQGEFSKAWNNIFGEANSLLEKFLQNLGEGLFNKGIEQIGQGLLGFLPGGNIISDVLFGGGDRRIVVNTILDGEVIATSESLVRGITANQNRMSAQGTL